MEVYGGWEAFRKVRGVEPELWPSAQGETEEQAIENLKNKYDIK